MRDLTPYRHFQVGFTLLETMVVIFLIALSITFAVVNLERDRDEIAALEADRFARLIEQARDASVLAGRPYAVNVDPDARSYGFLVHEGAWSPIEDDGVFRARRFPGFLDVALESRTEPGSEGLLVIDGLGAITPFVLTVRGESRRYDIRVTDSQDVTVAEEPDGKE